MLKLLLLFVLLFVAGCQSRRTEVKTYYEPKQGEGNVVEIVVDGVTTKEVRGALQSHTVIIEEGARDFSPGKHFEITVQGVGL